ncbi:MAG: hypothetical protein N2559_07065 [Anaerolineae bacterium]|nr:hypothetical protein [Anaerolineae bacterium]
MTTDVRIRTRRTLIDIARRHQRIGAGSTPTFLAQRTTKMVWLDLTPILAPMMWAVVGAAATRLYMPERATQDLDVAIRAQDATTVREKLARAGFTHLGELSIGGSTWRAPDGQTIDVIEGREEWWEEALREAQTNRDAQGLPILPLRFLVLMKFQAGHVQDLADITRMLGQAPPRELEAVRALFQRFASADLADLESLIALGKLETGVQ